MSKISEIRAGLNWLRQKFGWVFFIGEIILNSWLANKKMWLIVNLREILKTA